MSQIFQFMAGDKPCFKIHINNQKKFDIHQEDVNRVKETLEKLEEELEA